MHDPMTFEARLADAFDRYLTGAPVEVDASALAATITAARPRSRFALRQPAVRPRWATAVLVGLLILALAAAAAFVVGRLTKRPYVPWVYQDQLVAAPDLPAPQAFAELVALQDGRVLMLSGGNANGATATIFDPVAGTTRPAGSLVSAAALSISDAVRMADGRVMLVGDQRPGTLPSTPVVELFNPSTGMFRTIGPTVRPRGEASLVALADGRVLVLGGVDPTLGEWTPDDTYREVEAYDPSTNSFSVVAELPHASGFATSASVTPLPDGRAAAIVQVQQSDGLAGAVLEVFNPVTNEFLEIDPSDSGLADAPRLPFAATFESLRDGRILIVGETPDRDGAVRPGVSVIWDPRSDTFTTTKVAPWSYSSAIALDDGRLLLLGLYTLETGRPEGPWAATFDPETGDAKPIEGLTACYPGATRLPDGRVAFIGGLEDCQIRPEGGGQLAPAVPIVQIFQ